MITIPTYAGTTMCAANDTVAVVLDPSITHTDYGSDSTTRTWWAQFPFGRISGTYALLNRTCGQGSAISKLTDIDNNGNTRLVIGGEQYGKICWCKMTHPAVSKWVCNTFANQNGLSCILACSGKSHYAFPTAGLFGSIEN